MGRAAQLMVPALGEQQPGPALRATTCKRERLLALLLAAAPMRKWEHEREGESILSRGMAMRRLLAVLAALLVGVLRRQNTLQHTRNLRQHFASITGPHAVELTMLSGLAVDLAPLDKDELVGEGGAALTALLPVHFAALSRRVRSLSPAQLAAAGSGPLIAEWQALGQLLVQLDRGGQLSPARDSLAACMAAVMARWLPALSSCGGWQPALLLAADHLGLFSLNLLDQRMASATAAPTPRRGSSAGPPVQPLPVVCL